jgi:hypothetical protein
MFALGTEDDCSSSNYYSCDVMCVVMFDEEDCILGGCADDRGVGCY